jgi:hypothetical protein
MSSRTHPRRTRLLIGAIGVTTAGGALAFTFISSAAGTENTVATTVNADAAQVPQVKTAFTSAIQADRAAMAPAAATYGTVANAAVAAGRIAPAASSAVRDQQLQDGLAALGTYFAPAQAQHEAVGLRNAVAAEADPAFRNLGSGTSKIEFVEVAVAGSTATVQANVTAWAKFQQQEPGGKWITSNPVNVMVYTATLAKNPSGQWIISSLKGDFAPGEGP